MEISLLLELKAVPGSMFMIRTENNWPTLRHPIFLPTSGLVGGEDANLRYITAGNSLYSIRLNTKGYHLPLKK
jgi:hypothetical protein